jgi:ABC-2 type transport system ATP-binding protein
METKDYIALNVSDHTARPAGRIEDAHESAVVLDYDNLCVRRGEILGILGANGSGKSTLVRSLGAQLAADNDRIILSGRAMLQSERAVKRLINRVLADCSLFQRLTPVENLIYGARLYKLGEQEASARALAALKQAGLEEELARRPAQELDLEAQQKVVAACAALTQPALLLLDEPTAGLATDERRATQALIGELRDIYNAAILLTTSDAQEASALCDRVALLDAGRIVAVDTPYALKELND